MASPRPLACSLRRDAWPSSSYSPSAAFAVVMPLVMSGDPPAGAAGAVPAAEPAGGDAQLPARVRGDPAARAGRGPPARAQCRADAGDLARRCRACSRPALRRGGHRGEGVRRARPRRRRAARARAPRWPGGSSPAALVRAGRCARRRARSRAHAAPAWALAATALARCALLCFAELGSISLAGLGARARSAAGAAAAAAHDCVARCRVAAGVARRPRRCSRRARASSPTWSSSAPRQAAGDPAVALETGIIQFHHDFLLGPANEVLGGRAMLAGTASQYGVSSIYLLAAWFQLAPIGYGTLGLLDRRPDGALVRRRLRGSCASPARARLLAAGALGLAVVALALQPDLSGRRAARSPARCASGCRWLVIARGGRGGALPGAARGRARGRRWRALGLSRDLVARGVRLHRRRASPRSPAPGAWLGPADAPAPAGARRARGGAGLRRRPRACSPRATLAAAGSLPDWGEYLAYLDAFLFGTVGDLTYDVARWTPGLARRRRLPGLRRRARRAGAPARPARASASARRCSRSPA